MEITITGFFGRYLKDIIIADTIIENFNLVNYL